jgi:hypothetical protein
MPPAPVPGKERPAAGRGKIGAMKRCRLTRAAH